MRQNGYGPGWAAAMLLVSALLGAAVAANGPGGNQARDPRHGARGEDTRERDRNGHGHGDRDDRDHDDHVRGAVFGPIDVVREKSAPVRKSFEFELEHQSPGSFVLCVENGGHARQFAPVTSGRVSLNGAQVLGPSSFKNEYAVVAAPVVLRKKNSLTVEVSSNPRSGMTVVIESGTTCGGGGPVPNSPPVVTSTALTSATLLQPYSYQVVATDASGDTLTYSLPTAPLGMTIEATTGLITWLPPGTGALPVVVRVADQSGASATQPFTVTVGTAANRPPTIAQIPPRRIPAGAAFQLAITASDPDPGDTVTIALVSGPSGLTVNGHTLQWTPTLAHAGVHAVSLTATDAAGATAAGSLSIEVVASQGAPVLETLQAESTGAGMPYQRLISAMDPNPADTITFTLTAGPTGLTISPAGDLAWTPTIAQLGLHTVGVMVTDSTGLSDAGAFTIDVTVAPLPQPPTARPDRYAVRKGTTLDVPPPGILANDDDPQGRPLAATLANPPSRGSLSLHADGGFSYTTATTPTGSTAPALRFTHAFSDAGGTITANREQPIALDLDGDGATEIIYLGGSTFADRRLIAVHGRDGSTAWTVNAYQPAGTPPIMLCFSFCELSAGDLDGDGTPEIISVHSDDETAKLRRRLVAFNADGTYRWTSDDVLGGPVTQTIGMFHTAIADLDGDGSAEIVAVHVGKTAATPPGVVGEDMVTVFDSSGHIRWTTRVPGRSSGGELVVADLDVDGHPDIVIGGAVLRADGTILWTNKSIPFLGVSVANLDADPYGEIIYTNSSGGLYRFEHNGTQTWGGVINPALSGFSDVAIGDVDGDGSPELLMARDKVEVWSPGGVLLRTMSLPGALQGAGGTPTIFDLDGDGRPEVIYNGGASPFDAGFVRGGLYIFDGPTGTLLHSAQASRNAGDPQQSILVVDVDGDGGAEIVTGGWNEAKVLHVFTAASGVWAPTRGVWNQHGYQVTNVDEDGGIPTRESINWLTPGLNTFRVNALLPSSRVSERDTFTYVADNGSLTSSPAAVDIDILPPNTAPRILSTAPLQASPGLEYLYAVRAVDPDPGEILSFSLPIHPAGMTIDPATGLVRWTPPSAASGSEMVVVAATDSQGQASRQGFAIDIAAPFAVPDLTGLTLAGAPGALSTSQLSLGTVLNAPSSVVAPNVIMSQSPLAGTLLPGGSPVDVVVSTGPAPVAVPHVVGASEHAATALIESAGFAATITRVFSNTVEAGMVVSQSPAGGTPLVPGTVALTVSVGSGLRLRLQTNYTSANVSIPFSAVAYDLQYNETAASQLTYAVVPTKAPAFGANPAVNGSLIVPASSSRGGYRVTATDAAGHVAVAEFAVAFPADPALASDTAVLAAMNAAIADIARIGQQSRLALSAGDLVALEAALRQIVARWRQVDPLRVKLTTPFSMPQGFFPSPSDLATSGLTPTPDDLAAIHVLDQARLDLEAWTAVLADPNPSAPTVRALGDAFEAGAARFQSLTLSEWGVIKTQPLLTVLLTETYPDFYTALSDQLELVLQRAAGLPVAPRFAGPTARLAAFSLVELSTEIAVELIIDKICERLSPIEKLRSDALQNAAWGAAAVAAAGRFKTQIGGQPLTAVVAGASLQFHNFLVPDSFIEADLDPDNALNTVVVTIGPDQVSPIDFNAKLAVLTTAQSSYEVSDAMQKAYDFVVNGQTSGVATTLGGAFQGRGVPYRGCFFSSAPTCTQLVYPSGFKSVYTYTPPPGFQSFSGIPIPIVFMVFDKTSGRVYIDTPVFLPYQP